MLLFNNKRTLTHSGLTLATAILMAGCTNLHDFEMGQTHQQLKEMQTLDPEAAQRNEGIVLSLDGKYARRTIKAYQKSNSEPKTARKKYSSQKSSSSN